jgi:hypothetical protein
MMTTQELLDNCEPRTERDARLKPQTGHLPAFQSEYIDLLTAAMCKARPEIKAIKKNAKGNFGPYATLDEVIDAVSDCLPKYGLDLYSQPLVVGDQEWLISTLSHVSGQFRRASSVIRANPSKPQDALSWTTYYRRRDYACLCGIAADSDLDGEGLKGATPPSRGADAFKLATSALRAAKTEHDRDQTLARAALSVASGRMTEGELGDLRLAREALPAITKREVVGAK